MGKYKDEKRAIYLEWFAASDAHGDEAKRAFLEESYSDYLQSAWWKTIRELKLCLENETCESCGIYSDLEVHHKTYETLGDELPCDLQVLCHNCHTEKHSVALPEMDASKRLPAREEQLIALCLKDPDLRARIRSLFSEDAINHIENEPWYARSKSLNDDPYHDDPCLKADVLMGIERLRLKKEQERRNDFS